MPTLDIFNNDAFGVTTLTQSINTAPAKPGRIGELGWFEEKGISTTTAFIERIGSTLTLVPNAPRGAPGTPKHGSKRNMLPLMTTHLPQTSTILADEVQGVRAFGKETEVQTVTNLVNERLGSMKDDNEVTIEAQRAGVLAGTILDADGSVIIDLHQAFGVTRTPFVMGLNVGGTDVRKRCVEVDRLTKKELGNKRYTTKRALCSNSFLDALTAHAKVVSAFDKWQSGEFLRSDLKDGFYFGGIFWEAYDGGVGSNLFIPDGKAYLIPEGVPGLFKTVFAPADYMETVNTPGLPYYAKQEVMKFDKGVEIEAQSNPLSYCSLPLAVRELVIS